MALLLTECMRTLVKTKNEAKAKIQNKRMYLLQQLSKVVMWISKFEPQGINSKDLVIPKELQQMQGYTKSLLTNMSNEKLMYLGHKKFSEGLSKNPSMSDLMPYSNLSPIESVMNHPMVDLIRNESIPKLEIPHIDSKLEIIDRASPFKMQNKHETPGKFNPFVSYDHL